MKPLVPEDLKPHRDGVRDLSMRSLTRSAIAVGLSALEGGAIPGRSAPADFLSRRGWDGDRVGKLVTRASTGPAMTTDPAWAGELGTVALAFLESLRPMSAAAQLLGQCLRITFGSAAHVRLPSIAPGTASFVAENQPIRVSSLAVSAGPVLEPYKLATICELTREMMESSNAEALVRQALIDSTAPALDAALLSNTAAVAGLRPAGILVGATAVTASAGTTPSEAMADDLAALAGAISQYAGNGAIAYVMAPPQAVRAALVAGGSLAVLTSSSLTAGTVIALATNAVASAIEPVQIDASRAVSIHEADPAAVIATAGSPVVYAAPQRSLFQTDSVALRLRWPLSWTVRNPGAVAFVTATKW